jgi:hypothetical protein
MKNTSFQTSILWSLLVSVMHPVFTGIKVVSPSERDGSMVIF